MSRLVQLRVLQPLPYFPMLRPLPAWSDVPARREGDLEISHVPMFYLPLVLKSVDGFWLYRAIFKRLSKLSQNACIDVIDAHFGYPEGVGALLAASQLKIPVFVTLRGFEAEYLRKPIIGAQIRHVLRNADGVICVSHFLKGLALEHGATEDRVCVIHNSIDRSTFRPGDKAAAREELGLPRFSPVVLSVGHLVVRKRHHVLIRAFAILQQALPKALLLIAGGGSFEASYARKLEQLVKELGLQGSVRFLGNVPAHDIVRYYRAADIFALGTQREGCCNAVLESLACGVPVVTTPVGDNACFVKDGENGYIVPVDDHASMARAIRKAVERDNWDRDRISKELKIGSWRTIAEDVVEVFRDSIGRGATPTKRTVYDAQQ